MLKNFDIWLFSSCVLMKRYICPIYYDLEWQTKSFPHLLVSSFNAIYISSSSYRITSAWSCNPFVIPLTPSALLTQKTTLATWQPRWVIICIMNLIYVTQRHFTILRSHVTRDELFSFEARSPGITVRRRPHNLVSYTVKGKAKTVKARGRWC